MPSMDILLFLAIISMVSLLRVGGMVVAFRMKGDRANELTSSTSFKQGRIYPFYRSMISLGSSKTVDEGISVTGAFLFYF